MGAKCDKVNQGLSGLKNKFGNFIKLLRVTNLGFKAITKVSKGIQNVSTMTDQEENYGIAIKKMTQRYILKK